MDSTSPSGGSAIPLDVQFYRDVFVNGSHAQMKMFEQDFLCTYAWTTNLTNADVVTGMQWLRLESTPIFLLPLDDIVYKSVVCLCTVH